MKSPQDMRILQIDITNACIHKCSNCTRFCGHHKRPFFMDWETFRKAVHSFEGYKGTVGIMGGEPTLHPEFERFVRYIKEHPYFPKGENWLLSPVKNFMTMIAKMEQRDTYINKEHGIERNCVHGYGLWSALGTKYGDYYELIQDTFNFQAVNDHTQIMYHSPIMVRRKDLKIADDEWIKIRDNCWAQREWSATITPKGAFFCEIAGALDMLFDGPGGWPIEPGWWKRTPDEFGDQLKWCELCGIAFSSYTRNANEEVDDISPWYYNAMMELESPKVKAGLYNVLDISEDGVIDEKSKEGSKQIRRQAYADSYFSRFHNDWLNPKGIAGVMIADDIGKIAEYSRCIRANAQAFDQFYVVAEGEAVYEALKENASGVKLLLSKHETFGACINKLYGKIDDGYVIALLDGCGDVRDGACDFLKGYVFNPGTAIRKDAQYDMEDILGDGIIALFSQKAYAIKKASWPIVRESKCADDFFGLWERDKVLSLNKDTFTDYEYRIEADKKYAMYGIGAMAEEMYQLFSEGQVTVIADSDEEKWGKRFHGLSILSPDELYAQKRKYDKVFISSRQYFSIKTKLLEMGFGWDDIVTTLMVL